jgi:hypothetical protein
MALTFTKPKTPGQAATTSPGPTHSAPAATPEVETTTAKVLWMKRGVDAKKAMLREDTKAEERKAEQGKLWRFYVEQGKAGEITFLDGSLDAEGMLDIQVFYEHRVRISGDWNNFVCTAEIDQTQPCPLCENGDKPAFVGVMTVIDHTLHTIKNGPNAGKTITNTRKLFVAKRTTIKLLTTLAKKRGGLAGCTFDVTRPGDKDPAVGGNFDFSHKYSKLSEIGDKYGLKLEEVQPANYEEEVRYRTVEELIELGAGKAQSGVGYEKGASKLKDEL